MNAAQESDEVVLHLEHGDTELLYIRQKMVAVTILRVQRSLRTKTEDKTYRNPHVHLSDLNHHH